MVENKGERCAGYPLVKLRTLQGRVAAARDSRGTFVPSQCMVACLSSRMEIRRCSLRYSTSTQPYTGALWVTSITRGPVVHANKRPGLWYGQGEIPRQFQACRWQEVARRTCSRAHAAPGEEEKLALDKHRAMKRQPEWSATPYIAVAHASALVV